MKHALVTAPAHILVAVKQVVIFHGTTCSIE